MIMEIRCLSAMVALSLTAMLSGCMSTGRSCSPEVDATLGPYVKLGEKVEGGVCLSGGVANVEQLKSGMVLVTLGREDGNVMDCVVKLTLE